MSKKQRYYCKDCKSYFQSVSRPERLQQKLYKEYADDRKTLKVLAKENKRSISWVKSKLEKAQTSKKEVEPNGYVFVADCTFFGRICGYIIFRAPKLKKNIYVNSIIFETVYEYQKGRMKVQSLGFTFQAIVLDGRPGVRNLFNDIPVQMCHFHQKQIIKRHLTSNPKLEAGIELKKLTDTLANTTEEKFTTEFNDWCSKWDSFLKERTTDPITKRWSYTHKRVRSARRSLKVNLLFLFTYLRYPELNIPNTTNSLDGSFSWLKQDVNIHRGMNKGNRNKITEYLLSN